MAEAMRKKNNLADKNPEIAAEWHPTKNGNITPAEVACGSHTKYWWVCSLGHEYEQSPNKRVYRGYNCQYCSGHKALKGFNDLATINPTLAKEWHPTKNGGLTPFDVTVGSGKQVWWQCPIGHDYQAVIRDRNTDNTQCPVCNKFRQTSFPEQAIFYYVRQLYPDATNKYREIFSHTMELDIYIPSIRLGIEFDGANWHKTEKQHEREVKKYKICKENNITLFRIKEDTDEHWRDVADGIWNIKKVKKLTELENTIQTIMDSLDRDSNMLTRKNPLCFQSSIKVDLERDRTEILSYLSEIKNSLDTERPDVAAKWNYEKNGILTPAMFTVSSNQIVWWQCPDCGHEWKSSVNSMTREGRNGCKKCADAVRGSNFTKICVKKKGSLAETMPELVDEWHPTKNAPLTPLNITAGKNEPVWWRCRVCEHEWPASPANRKKGSGCPCCSGRVPKSGVNDLATKFPELLEEWDYNKNSSLDPSKLLPGSSKKAWWKCKRCGYEWPTIISNRTKGHGCRKCARKK